MELSNNMIWLLRPLTAISKEHKKREYVVSENLLKVINTDKAASAYIFGELGLSLTTHHLSNNHNVIYSTVRGELVLVHGEGGLVPCTIDGKLIKPTFWGQHE